MEKQVEAWAPTFSLLRRGEKRKIAVFMDNLRGSSLQPASVASEGSPLSPAEERVTLNKVTWRLIPLLFFSYVIAYIDRINVGFAKFQLREVLGVDEAIFDSVFGLGAGLFFIGYFIFEVPSNLILERVGARIWIARIMIGWGVISMAFMFMKGVTTFYVMRFLLGVAEAGFFPGVILYLTYWYPPKERARNIALFAVGGVLAGVIGSPLSGALLAMDGIGGLGGWQWLFLIEGIPAVLMGLVVLWLLPNGPGQARWLSDREKAWILNRVKESAPTPGSSRSHAWSFAFTSPFVWLLCLIYFLQNIGGYGYQMWLPTIIKGFSGQSDTVVGFLTAVPYFVAGLGMLVMGKHSDHSGERRRHIAVAAASAAVGFAIAAYFRNPWVAMAGLTLAFVGLKSTLGPFWALTTTFLSSTAAPGGIAFINSVGNLGGFVGPSLVGVIKDATKSDTAALMLLGGSLLLMGVFALTLPAKFSNPQKPNT